LLRKDSEEEEKIVVSADFSVWFLQVILRDLCIANCNVGQWLEIMFQLAACSSKRSANSL